MNWFKMIKGFFEKGYWTKEMVSDGVVAKKITESQFEEITGEEYLIE